MVRPARKLEPNWCAGSGVGISSLSGDDFIAEKFLSYEQKRVGENREIEYSRNKPLHHKPNNILKRHTK